MCSWHSLSSEETERPHILHFSWPVCVCACMWLCVCVEIAYVTCMFRPSNCVLLAHTHRMIPSDRFIILMECRWVRNNTCGLRCWWQVLGFTLLRRIVCTLGLHDSQLIRALHARLLTWRWRYSGVHMTKIRRKCAWTQIFDFWRPVNRRGYISGRTKSACALRVRKWHLLNWRNWPVHCVGRQ